MKAITRFLPIALMLVICLTSCLGLKEVNITGIKDITVVGQDENGLRLNVLVGIENPNNMRIKIKNAEIDALANGNKLGTAILAEKVIIQKRSSEMVPMDFYLKGKDLFSGSAGAILSTLLSQRAEVQMKGEIKIKAYGIGKKIPVDMKQEITLPGLF